MCQQTECMWHVRKSKQEEKNTGDARFFIAQYTVYGIQEFRAFHGSVKEIRRLRRYRGMKTRKYMPPSGHTLPLPGQLRIAGRNIARCRRIFDRTLIYIVLLLPRCHLGFSRSSVRDASANMQTRMAETCTYMCVCIHACYASTRICCVVVRARSSSSKESCASCLAG